MGRTKDKLSAKKVESLTEIGRHSDGGGLYLKVTESGKRWIFMYAWHGKRVELGLGTADDVSLRSAREIAQRYRSLIASTPKIDPRVERAKAKERAVTFGTFALEFVDGKKEGWRNDKHKDQWLYSLSLRKGTDGKWLDDGFCVAIRSVPVPEIAVDDILRVLRPIWLTKGETARRLRGRIETVLDAAKSVGLREGDNPAEWRGNLKNLLPDKKKVEVQHHAAMPYNEVAPFLAKLLHARSPSSLALAFAILTAARSGEVMGATWAEIDLEEAMWRVPADRMKGGREHTVPLSDGALPILRTIKEEHGRPGNDFVFPGQRGKGLSVMALTMAMRRLGAGNFTPHGFRSAFRDWAGDSTSFQRDDIEQCLAHAIANKVEAAYRRGQALDKRRKIMEAWSRFLSGDSSSVTPFIKGAEQSA